jgi:hypothetical protein
LQQRPEALQERDYDKFWLDEDFDKHLPEPGFLTDLVLTLRGIETPTIFALWTGIFIMSSLLKRDAFLKWFPDPVYPNFYVLLVAPPKVCAKSTSISFGSKMLIEYPKLLTEALRFRKMPNIVSTRATPESLSDAMLPEEFKYLEGTEIKTYRKGSELTIIAGEASTFLGKQKYNVGLIDKLTHLYDSSDVDQDRTRKTGVQHFENTYVTFMGATTPEGVRQSIPEEAFEGGFMSRLIVVYQNHATRAYPFPRIVGPTRKDLNPRLAWIAENAKGAYVLDSKALELHERWYPGFHSSLETNAGSDRHKAMYHRFDIHLLKLALIMRAQRYEPGNVITAYDYMQAKAVLDATLDREHSPVEDVGSSIYGKHYNRIMKLVSEQPRKRTNLLQAMSPYECTADEVSKIINNLAEEGKVHIILDQKEHPMASKNGREIYSWAGLQVNKESK